MWKISIRRGAYSITYFPVIGDNINDGGGHQEDMTTGWMMNWIQEIGGSSLHPPTPHPCHPSHPWNLYPAWHSHSGSHFQIPSLERAMSCRDHLNGICDKPVKASVLTFKTLADQSGDLLVLWPLMRSLVVCKSLCLFNLPSANLEWSTSFFVSPCSEASL